MKTSPAKCSGNLLFLLMALGLLTSRTAISAADWPQWRGPARDGHSSEKGLLKEWPTAGPKLIWQSTEAGSGYSTPAVVGERLYLLGNDGLENESVRALSVQDGKQIWAKRLGQVGNPKQQPSFPAARSTPTVDGDVLYALGSDGDLACLELKTGNVRWQKNLRKDFGGKPGEWAYSESPLVDGNVVFCTPGGREAAIVALNKSNGELVWKCTLPEGDDAAYASPILLESGGKKQTLHQLKKALVGVDAKTGKLLWRYDKAVSRYGANIPTPVTADGLIYTAGAGTGGGGFKLKAREDGFEVEQIYFEAKLPASIGGSVKVGDYLYGTTAQALLCIEFATGKIKWEERALGAASLCVADGCLYLQGENGTVALVEATPEGYREKGRFTPSERPKRSQGMEKAWTYPVVAQGRLFLRDHNVVWCYAVK
jgi:outer membrane protein assembly factor BamB